MALILGLDVATATGWALYDTDKPVSAITSGSIRMEGDGPFEKVACMRRELPRLIKGIHDREAVEAAKEDREARRIAIGAIEAPLEFAPQFKKVKKTLLGEEETTSSINPRTIAMLNRLAGAAQMAVQGQNIRCVEVRPQTWQSIIPKTISGKPKQRAQTFCEMLRIVSPNMDSRDACIIAYWAAGHCQELKLIERARAA